MLLFWAQQKRLNKVTITKLSRFLLFLRAYYVQKVCTQDRSWRIVIKLCLGVDVAKSEDEEFSVVDAVEFSPESLDFRVY